MNAFLGAAPNVHPLLVHLPIGLLAGAVVLDLVSVVWRAAPLRQVTTALYVLGAAAAVATYFTGQAASNEIYLPGMAQAVVHDHAVWALRTVWFFGALAVARLVLASSARRPPRAAFAVLLALLGLVGLGLLRETSDRGGRLVYEYGVGVAR
jgi:uncharacterized membrane protein